MPGRLDLPDAPSDWPTTLWPGSLNVRIDRYRRVLHAHGVLEQLTPDTRDRELEHSRASLRVVEQGISNLAQAIAQAGDLGTLLHELHAARAKRDALMTTIAALERSDLRQFDRGAIDQKVRAHLSQWQSLLSTRHVQDGRQLLREVLTGPPRFTPERRSYRFEGEKKAGVGQLLAGMADVAPLLVAVRGIEPRFDG